MSFYGFLAECCYFEQFVGLRTYFGFYNTRATSGCFSGIISFARDSFNFFVNPKRTNFGKLKLAASITT